jgi:hypothetical protein
LVELTKVIEKEKKKDGNQKSTNQTSDSLDALSSQESFQTKASDKIQSMESEGSED